MTGQLNHGQLNHGQLNHGQLNHGQLSKGQIQIERLFVYPSAKIVLMSTIMTAIDLDRINAGIALILIVIVLISYCSFICEFRTHITSLSSSVSSPPNTSWPHPEVMQRTPRNASSASLSASRDRVAYAGEAGRQAGEKRRVRWSQGRRRRASKYTKL